MSFGRLERSKAPEPMSQINVTPLVDVMLVLVVIFIVTAPLMAGSLQLDLPRSDAAAPAQTAEFVTVAVNKDGKVFLGPQNLGLAELASRLAETAKRDPATEVQLRADQGVPYGRVVEVMGAVQGAGLNRIGFVTENQPPAR